MKKTHIQLIAAIAILAVSCKNKASNNNTGTDAAQFKMTPRDQYASSDGKPLDTKLSYPASYDPDSIVYFLDSVRIGVKKDSSALSINTDTVHMGQRTIWAKIYKGGESRKFTTTFYMAPGQMPEKLTYNVIRKFPHDTTSNTEGLSYQDGFLYETSGDTIKSEIRKVDLETGKVLQRQKLGIKNYGKGNTIVGDKVIVLVAKQKFGLLFDKNTLKPLGKFERTGYGDWGITTDGQKLYSNDGGSHIWLVDRNTYKERGVLDIFDHEAPVEQINEMEYVDGKYNKLDYISKEGVS